MKKTFLFFYLFSLVLVSYSQPAGYYNGTEDKSGVTLKDTLHKIIRGHIDYSYSQAKYLINYSDADPNNAANVILFYTQRSQDADSYGTGGDFINREHVWAKSHGDFSGKRPMDGDAFNLRPADASVNMLKSNLDFDECSATGTPVSEAPGTYYTSTQWEPADAVKGQVARILFYMATRYEGTNSEIDLEMADAVNTAPAPEHGKLSTLLQWNRDYPPTDFEHRRNERIYHTQKNRNPFIDNPEFADLIWGGSSVSDIQIGTLSMDPLYALAGGSASISADIQSGSALTGITLFWGSAFNSETNQVAMSGSGSTYTGSLNLTAYSAGDFIFYKIIATDGINTQILRGSYEIPQDISQGSITTIADIQGTGPSSPLNSQTVTTAGIVVANYDNSFYIQDGTDPYSGVCVFGSNMAGRVGDSIVLTADVTEYQNLTELGFPEYTYIYKGERQPEPVELTASQIGEAYEGMLVTIKNAQFNDGGATIPDNNTTYIFNDATGSSQVFSRYGSRLVGHELPSGTVDITGVVSQYQSDYQILVRDMNDFNAGNDNQPPAIVAVNVQDKDWLMIDFNEKLDLTSAQTSSNYSLNNNITVLGAYIYEETHVSLNISGMETGTHTLTVNGVKDLAGNPISNGTKEFSYTSTNKVEIENTDISIYPNPAQDVLFINMETTTSSLIKLEILDLSGKTMILDHHGLSAGGNSIELNISELAPGIYIIKIQTGEQSVIKKLIIK